MEGYNERSPSISFLSQVDILPGLIYVLAYYWQQPTTYVCC